jgi:predicted ribosomally synthesized peptide with SipW-like signal peptide
MKNIVLSIVVIATLVVAGIGGTLADFSDYEVSEDNYFATGAMDLVVSDEDGNDYNGETVPEVFRVTDGWPCCSKDRSFDLHNVGNNEQEPPIVYLHIKNLECGWVMPKVVYEWIDCDNGDCIIVSAPANPPVQGSRNTGLPKPVTEPEFVAECGGIAGEDVDGEPVEVPGVGCCYGENCELSQHVDVTIRVAGPYTGPWDDVNKTGTPPTADDVPSAHWRILDLTSYDPDPSDIVKMDELECQQIELGELAGCYTLWVNISLHLQDVDEDDLIAAGILTDPGTGYGWFDDTIPAEAKWDHWPTNALQNDVMWFDMGFELLQD